jgi:dienelactone hydrolase
MAAIFELPTAEQGAKQFKKETSKQQERVRSGRALLDKLDQKTVVIVLHEIYGVNNHINNVCKKLQEFGFAVIAPNLLNGRGPFRAEQEQAAYEYFMSRVSFLGALEVVQDVLVGAREQYDNVYLLGYSIGATLAWLAAQTGLCDLCIGFYGSRIRDYLAVQPKCKTLLFFPEREKSFDVDNLLVNLSRMENVQAVKLAGQHGFANPFSKSYHEASTATAWLEIEKVFYAQRKPD